MKGISKMGMVVLVVLIVGAGILAIKYNKEPRKNSIQNDAGSVDVTVKTIERKTAYASIHAEFPQFDKVPVAFNKKIEALITTAITDHEKKSAENWKARWETSGKDGSVAEFPAPNELLEFFASWEPKEISPNRISILIRFGGFSGGAHGYEDVGTFNYDLKNNHEITLADMFPTDQNYLQTISGFARNELIAHFKDVYRADAPGKTVKEQEQWFNDSIVSAIKDGTTPTIENFQNFTIEPHTITFYFPRYQVASYAAGEQRVVMPRL